MTELGVAKNYTIAVTPKDGFGNIGFLEPSSLTWHRALNDTSEATLTINLSSGNAECCALASQLRTWGHQIRISRDGVLVWEGPIVDLDYGREALVITARDVVTWLARRVVRSILDFRTGADLTTIAFALIEHGFAPDDPNVMAYVSTELTGISGERYYMPDEVTYIIDGLNELANTGVDYTCIGRRIAVFPELSSDSLPVFRQDDFLDELHVREDGLSGATYAQIRGAGVVGTFGGTSEFYGLLERVATEDNILDLPTANLRAQAVVQAGNPMPLYVTTPGQSRLACSAPVHINQLVPGIRIPITIAVGELCRSVSTLMRLVALEVTVEAGEESISVELALPGRQDQ